MKYRETTKMINAAAQSRFSACFGANFMWHKSCLKVSVGFPVLILILFVMSNLKIKILLIEDDIQHATLILRWLGSKPEYFMTHAADGRDGANAALHGDWDLIISDIDLPYMNGLDLSLQSKMCNPLIPFILITAHEEINYPLQAIQNKVDDFLIKPFEKNILLEKVENILACSSKERRFNQKRVLAIGAHPDDVEIGCGGSLLRHVGRNDKICLLITSNGEQGGEAEKRVQEIYNVGKILNAQIVIGDLPDTKISEGPETISLIKNVIDDFNPNVIYTHSINEAHQDHRNVHRASMVASRGVPTVYCYQSPSTTIQFQPSLFVDISNHISGKIHMISMYETQAQRAYLQENIIRSTARYWGRFSNFKDIEPLEVMRTGE